MLVNIILYFFIFKEHFLFSIFLSYDLRIFYFITNKKPTTPSATTDSAVGFISAPTLPASLLRSVLTMYTYSPDQTAAERNNRADIFHSAVPYGSR